MLKIFSQSLQFRSFFVALAHETGHQKWYFLSRLRQQGRNFNRQAPGGFWRKTGSDYYVNDENGRPAAKKTSLVFH